MTDFWKGMALPWKGDLASLVDPKDDEDVLASSIHWILLTSPGERLMRPEFGTSLGKLLFEPNQPNLVRTLERVVKEALARWDDRVVFVGVKIIQQREHHLSFLVQFRREKQGDLNISQVQIAVKTGV